MNIITLQQIPNQSFNITLDDSFYEISIREANGLMVADIVRDSIPIISGVRLVGGTFLMPYKYEEPGNFMVLNLNNDLIYYTNFGVTQNLAYVSAGDLEVLRSP